MSDIETLKQIIAKCEVAGPGYRERLDALRNKLNALESSSNASDINNNVIQPREYPNLKQI